MMEKESLEASVARDNVSGATRKVSLSVPAHMQHVPSYLSLGVLSDSDSEEVRSRSSGIEMDMDYCDMSVNQEVDCATHLQELIFEDLERNIENNGRKRPPASKQLPSKWKLSWPLLVFLVIGVVLVIFGRGHLFQLLDWLEQLPWIRRLFVFITLFTLVSFPFGFGYLILNMMAGYLYGFFYGQIVVMVSVAMGFSIAFVLCRYWLQGYARSISTSNALRALMRVVDGPSGLKVILLTRLTPIPFGLQNALFAMTRVSYLTCFVASLIGLLPTQLLNTYMGSTVRNMQEVLADRVDGYIILSAQVIISIVLMLYLLRKAKIELAKLTCMDVETGDADSVSCS